jgi:hypothetical protein
MSTTTGTETVDRQRQRAERGVGTTRKPGGRLPTNTKRRRPAMAALAALLIVGGALIAGLLAIRMDERRANEIIGAYARVNLIKGELLDPLQLTKTDPITPGKAAVGIVLVGGRIPAAGLKSGDQIEMVRIGQGNQQPVLIGTGTVLAVPTQSADSAGLGDKASVSQTATVLVDRELVKAVTDASGNNRIAVALLKSGTSVEGK